MSGADADDRQEQFVRPFLDRQQPLAPLPPDEVLAESSGLVRAYTMTGGRAHSATQLEFETMMQATADGREAFTANRFERADILRLSQHEPLSVAELAARLHVPIGVVRVVAGDLIAEGLVEVFRPSTVVSDDVLLITRLIAGVRAL